MAYTKRVMTEAKAVIDLNVRRYHWQTADSYAKDLKDAASDLMDFLRDHRSRDGYSIDIQLVCGSAAGQAAGDASGALYSERGG